MNRLHHKQQYTTIVHVQAQIQGFPVLDRPIKEESCIRDDSDGLHCQWCCSIFNRIIQKKKLELLIRTAG